LNIFGSKDILSLKTDIDKTGNFIESGGDSLKALLFIDKLEHEFQQLHVSLKTNLLLDVLLNRSFGDVLTLIERELKDQPGSCFVDSEKSRKRMKQEDTGNEKIEKQPAVRLRDSNKSGKLRIELEWKVDTGKCVDASPRILVTSLQQELVFIGSHSHKFLCVNGASGELKWSFEANDRIESSACVSKCGQFVVFGKLNYK
jgi:hypothetical protein